MKIFARSLFAALTLASVAAHADVPVYRGQQLDVPSAVVVTDRGPVYYGDVRFVANQDGSFSLAHARRRNLAQIYSATLDVDAGAAEVAVTGITSIACVGLEEPAVVRDGNTFYVVVAETPIDPLALCMSLQAVQPFALEVPLDLTGVEPGTYEVDVNGVITSLVVN